jgi:aminoglycoside 2''-phosphotransferase
LSEKNWDFEDTREPDFQISEVIDLIKPYYSLINEKNVVCLHHGTYNVYEVNNEYIFRIPDKTIYNEKGFELIKSEMEKLNFLRDKLSKPIPFVEFVSKDVDKPLVGYKKIPGTSISKHWKFIPEDKKIAIAKSIGSFLSELHNENLLEKYSSRFNKKKTTNLDIKNHFLDIYKQTKEKIFPMLSNDLSSYIEQFFKKFLTDCDQNYFEARVTHLDFDTSNILINTEDYAISGIIDFEDTDINDPAYDFPFISEGEEFFKTVLNNYSGQKDNFLLSRIKFYYQRAGISYILYGLEHKIQSMVDYGIYLLEKRKTTPFELKFS